MTTTVAELRELLTRAWPRERVATVQLRLREQGLLPAGKGGSARIGPIHAAITLLALALDDGDAHAALALAERVGAFKLVAVDQTVGATTTRRPVQGSDVRPVTAVAGDIATAARDPEYRPKGWRVSGDEATQDAPERLVFRGDELPAYDAAPVTRTTTISGTLLRAVGHLFAPARAEAA